MTVLRTLPADRRARHRAGQLPHAWKPVVGVAAILSAWVVASYGAGVPQEVIPSPGSVAVQAGAWLGDGTLVSALGSSSSRAFLGLLVGGVAGVVLGFVSAAWRLGEDVIDPLAQAFNAIPVAGMVGLFIIWFGIGDEAKIALVAAGTFYPLYLHVYSGVRLADRTLVEAARSLGYSSAGALVRVGVPSALPHLFVGLRQSTAIAWLILVIAEQVNATNGLGWLMTRGLQAFRLDQVFVCLVTYAAIGGAIYATVSALERLCSWRDTI